MVWRRKEFLAQNATSQATYWLKRHGLGATIGNSSWSVNDDLTAVQRSAAGIDDLMRYSLDATAAVDVHAALA